MTKMAGISREQEDAEQASNGLGFKRPKRAAAPPSKAAGGGTAKEADGGAREAGEPPVLTFEPPRRRVALPARDGKGGTATASTPRVPGAKRRTLKEAEPARSGLKQRLTAWIIDS
jgi:hypothetical protein